MSFSRSLLLPLLLASTAGVASCGDNQSGSAQRTTGEIEEAAGQVIGSEELQREGREDQVVGGVRDAASDVKDAVKDAVD